MDYKIKPFSNTEIPIAALPSLEDTKYHSLSPLYSKLVLIQMLIFLSVPSVMIVTTILYLEYSDLTSEINKVLLYLAAGATVILFSLSVIYRYFEAKTIRYCLREHDLIFDAGILVKRTVVQPLLRVQHLEVSRNPLEMKWGLASLKLFSAGGIRHTFIIPGLTEEHANQLRQYVLDYQEQFHE